VRGFAGCVLPHTCPRAIMLCGQWAASATAPSHRASPSKSRAGPRTKLMRIAQVAPLYESVPPKCYGGTERIVSYLTEELVDQGHDVTLFASGDSVTDARLIA